MVSNPSLREEPIEQRSAVIPSKQQSSILDWLEGTGRLISRDAHERDLLNEDEEIEEINELMTGEDMDYDDDDSDDVADGDD